MFYIIVPVSQNEISIRKFQIKYHLFEGQFPITDSQYALKAWQHYVDNYFLITVASLITESC